MTSNKTEHVARDIIDLDNFEQDIINGRITDYRPYVENGTFHENRAYKQMCIKHGVARELYPEWAQSNDLDKYDNWIQLLLAEKGYCLDILSESGDPEILSEVLHHDLNYALNDTMLTTYRHVVTDAIMQSADIPLKVLEQYLATKDDEDDETALELKQKAMSITPNTIEKTMTPAQLYVVNNPLWALDFTGYDINRLLMRLGNQPQTEETFNATLHNVQTPMLILDETGKLTLNKEHPNNQA